MKRCPLSTIVFALLMIALVGWGCGQVDQLVTSEEHEPLNLTEQPVRLAKATVFKRSIDQTLWNPCEGEGVRITGSVHITSNIIRDANGKTLRTFHRNYQGVVGEGLSSGTIYRVQRNVKRTRNNWNASGSAQVNSIVVALRFVAQGSNKSYTLRLKTHLTINANGERVVNFSDFSIECN